MKKTNSCRIGRRPTKFELHVHDILLKIFCDFCNSPSLIFFLATMTHNMTAREGFAMFGSFLNFYARFKLYSKWWAWRSFARGGVSLNLHQISDEIAYYEPKKDFYKKYWALYTVPVVQIWPASYRFSRNLSFLWGVDRKVPDTPVGKLSILVGLVFLKNVLVPMWNFNLVVASQITPFSAPRKWKMAFSFDEKENFLLQHRKISQDAHVCTIWAYYHKLCRDSISNIGRLT